MKKIKSKCCEWVKLSHINCSSPVFFRHSVIIIIIKINHLFILTHFCFVISVQFCFVTQQVWVGRPHGTLASPAFLNFFNFFSYPRFFRGFKK